MKKGKAGDPVYKDFVDDIDVAIGEAEGKALDAITDAFENPENAKWYLERARPAGYSKEVNLKVDAILNDFMDRLQDGLPPDIFDKVLAVASGAGLPEAAPARFTLPPAKVVDAVIES